MANRPIKKTQKYYQTIKKIEKKLATAPHKPLSKPDFAMLQRHWHEKAAKTGFKDLEHFNRDGACGELLKYKSIKTLGRELKRDNFKFELYRRLQNFCTHQKRWPNRRARLLSESYAAGLTLPAITKLLKSKRLVPCSLWAVHRDVDLFIAAALAWNKRHHEGIDFVPDIG